MIAYLQQRSLWRWIVLLCVIVALFSGTGQVRASHASAATTAQDVQLQVSGMTAVISNDMYTIKFDSFGTAYSLVWKGQELIGPAKGFYSSVNGGTAFIPTQLLVTTSTTKMADIAYVSSWGELHYVVRKGVSGLYSYFVATNIGTVGEFRTLYRVDGSIFRNGYNAERSGAFPTLSDIQQSATIQNETFQLPDGTVYTKYDWSSYIAQDHVHGMYGGGYGVWMIPASHEYYPSGPMKQDLMVHVESRTGDGTILNMLMGSHFGTPSIAIPSGKIYGPWLVYFNNGSIPDAQAQADEQEELWPYSWLSNPNYPLSRTTVSGTLRFANGLSANGAVVTLAQPGGDIYDQGSGYIFSVQADPSGYFRIPNVRPGNYSLYAYANGGRTDDGRIGSVTDQYELDNVNVSGSRLELGPLVWSPPTYANSLWQIGQANRKADEFNLGNLPRQYGLFNQTPANLTYTIGQSTPANDWYYAQTQAGSWTVNFNLSQAYTGTGHLTVALAGASRTANIQVAVNGTSIGALPTYTNDAAIYRSANQSGHYHLALLTFDASLLTAGNNTVTFQATNVSSGGGVMYDTIKLEVG